jgi:hypothetical protein
VDDINNEMKLNDKDKNDSVHGASSVVDISSYQVGSSKFNSAMQQQMMIVISEIAKQCKTGKEEFTKVNPAEYMPEVCNEFVTIFLEQREDYIDRGDAIDLTLNFCSWLYKKGHTCIKLSVKNYS